MLLVLLLLLLLMLLLLFFCVVHATVLSLLVGWLVGWLLFLLLLLLLMCEIVFVDLAQRALCTGAGAIPGTCTGHGCRRGQSRNESAGHRDKPRGHGRVGGPTPHGWRVLKGRWHWRGRRRGGGGTGAGAGSSAGASDGVTAGTAGAGPGGECGSVDDSRVGEACVHASTRSGLGWLRLARKVHPQPPQPRRLLRVAPQHGPSVGIRGSAQEGGKRTGGRCRD